MLREQLVQACTMRADGYTYEEIGKHLGYTKQHIQQELVKMLQTKDYKISEKTIYPNLLREIKIKYKTMKAFAQNTGFNYRRICAVLDGESKALLDEAIFLSEHFNKDILYLFDKKK